MCFLDEFEHLLIGTCQFYTLTHQHKRLDALVDHLGRFLDHQLVAHRLWDIRTDEVDLLWFVVDDRGLRILGEVEHDGTRTSGASDIERTSHGPCHIFGTTNLIVPLADWLCHAHHIDLLEGICTQHGCTYLSANDNKGCGVNHCISNAGDGVHGSWARSYQYHTCTSTDAGIALGSMDGTLLMSYQHMIEFVAVIIECIISWHNGTSRITEESSDSLILEAAHQRFCTRYSF